MIPVEVIPLNTKIITPEDDLCDIIATYAGPFLKEGDILVVAESVVAITQGRIIRPDYVKPGFWARVLARFIHQDGSLSSPYAMQVIMKEEGVIRTLAAFFIAALTRLLAGRRGDFYRLAGEQASLIDDITGTMPPFDKHIVLGPREPEKVAAEIKRRFGVEAAIIDANDLGRSKLLATTPGVNHPLLIKVFQKNPAGNADQQTPLVIVRKVRRKASSLGPVRRSGR
ncbi:MAG: coenzyme F420-0:L-glutamate ligase [Bacillota bacterium]|nr:coenzyme F420-0:L-glutamate ligase [Bacillota bacterium]